MTAARKTATEARVVDGAMIASFMGAEPPKVWRADLKSLSTATFEMKEDAGAFHVVMRTGEQTENIAAFTSKDGATEALQVLMTAMLAPAATVVPAAGEVAAAPVKKSFFRRLLRFVLKAVAWLFGIAFVLWLTLVGLVLKDPGMTRVQQGTPVPADDLFGQ
jgi:hypothetical protein